MPIIKATTAGDCYMAAPIVSCATFLVDTKLGDAEVGGLWHGTA